MSKRKDTDYLSISARVRAMENGLLSRERMERMLEARSNEDAAKILSECGYGELSAFTPAALDEVLVKARNEMYLDLAGAVPEPGLVDVFRMKYDYHNLKVLLKSEAVGVNAARLFVQGGRYAPDTLREAYLKDDLRDCSETFAAAAAQAKETLSASADPQLADFVLDRAYFEEMLLAAKENGSAFLLGYVRLLADTANLRAAVRCARMGRGTEFLSLVLVPGGGVGEKTVATAKTADLGAVFKNSRLAQAAALGAAVAAPGGARLTEFERACDNALMHYLAEAKLIPFGEQPVVGYLCARESELTAIRIIMTGRLAGLDTETIRERLRESYV